MPALFLLLLACVIRAVTLPGAKEGLTFMLTIRPESFNGNTLVGALGQAFFSLSVGMGIMVTYGSYVPKDDHLVKSAVSICALDTMAVSYTHLDVYKRQVFIFTFHMGVRGAALATILSQFLSALWIVKFLTGRKAILRLKTSAFRLKKERVKNIVALGMSGFTMAITNSSVQIMYNASLQHYGGDCLLYTSRCV